MARLKPVYGRKEILFDELGYIRKWQPTRKEIDYITVFPDSDLKGLQCLDEYRLRQCKVKNGKIIIEKQIPPAALKKAKDFEKKYPTDQKVDILLKAVQDPNDPEFLQYVKIRRMLDYE
jgi:hypothetical protein